MATLFEIVFADYFEYFGFSPQTIGILAQVCRDFAAKSHFTAAAIGCTYILSVCGAEIMRLGMSGEKLITIHRGVEKVVSYSVCRYAVPDIYRESVYGPTVVIKLYNGIMVRFRKMIYHMLRVCNIPHKVIVIDDPSKSGPSHTIRSMIVDGYRVTHNGTLLRIRGYNHAATAIIITNCRNGKIKIGKRRIRCGRIRLDLNGDGPYEYILGADLFTSHHSPDDIDSCNSILRYMLLVVKKYVPPADFYEKSPASYFQRRTNLAPLQTSANSNKSAYDPDNITRFTYKSVVTKMYASLYWWNLLIIVIFDSRPRWYKVTFFPRTVMYESPWTRVPPLVSNSPASQ